MDSTITVMNKNDILQGVHIARQKLIFPRISIDGYTHTAEVKGVSVHLTPNEFKILYLLACFPDEVLSPKEIFHAVWQAEDLGCVDTVLMHVANLRKKLRIADPDHDFILTLWKKGYKFLSQ